MKKKYFVYDCDGNWLGYVLARTTKEIYYKGKIHRLLTETVPMFPDETVLEHNSRLLDLTLQHWSIIMEILNNK